MISADNIDPFFSKVDNLFFSVSKIK